MYQIRKSFTFEAAHQLRGLPERHKCGRMHGHSYSATLVLESESLDERGFVRDYGDISATAKTMIDHLLDHRTLNEVGERQNIAELIQPTAENIARYLYTMFEDAWPELVAVHVAETRGTRAAFSPSGRGL